MTNVTRLSANSPLGPVPRWCLGQPRRDDVLLDKNPCVLQVYAPCIRTGVGVLLQPLYSVLDSLASRCQAVIYAVLAPPRFSLAGLPVLREKVVLWDYHTSLCF